jgi:hypothetical protein
VLTGLKTEQASAAAKARQSRSRRRRSCTWHNSSAVRRSKRFGG